MGYKKSSPDKTDELLNILKSIRSYISGLSFPYARDGVGTFSRAGGRGCQGIIGPLPSAFLDKYIKELLQIYNRPVN